MVQCFRDFINQQYQSKMSRFPLFEVQIGIHRIVCFVNKKIVSLCTSVSSNLGQRQAYNLKIHLIAWWVNELYFISVTHIARGQCSIIQEIIHHSVTSNMKNGIMIWNRTTLNPLYMTSIYIKIVGLVMINYCRKLVCHYCGLFIRGNTLLK